MSDTTTLKSIPRTDLGTRAARQLRANNQIPAVIYGHGETPETITFSLRDIEIALAHGARTLNVDIAGTTKPYLIKQVQYDYLGQDPVHLDLTRVNLDERVKVRVGIELRGVPKGVGDGGVLDQAMADIEVECLVTAIPETFHPFVTELAVGESLLVKDLELPSGVVAMVDDEERVASVRAPAVVVDDEEAAEEGGEGSSEPERIGRVRKDEAGEAEGQA